MKNFSYIHGCGVASESDAAPVMARMVVRNSIVFSILLGIWKCEKFVRTVQRVAGFGIRSAPPFVTKVRFLGRNDRHGPLISDDL